MKKNSIRYFFSFIAFFLFLAASLVWFFDPFYQYHAPFLGLKPVLYERETQMAGSIRNLPYDSCLVGSSVVENCDTDYLDTVLGIKTLKIVKGSGSAPDLMYYLNMAQQEKELSYVFYGLDLFSLMDTTEVTVVSEYSPKYLFTDTILDDFTYLFNKDILFKKIPLNILYSLQGKYCDGKAYNWAEGKTFSAKQAMKAYAGPGEMQEPVDFSEDKPVILENIRSIEEMVKAHPGTKYIFFLPPYSLLNWDEIVRAGEKDKYLFALEQVFAALLPYENVEIYSFQMDRDIICDLNFYMDKVHFSTQINQYMLQCMLEKSIEYRVTRENTDVFLQLFSETCDYIVKEGIYQYYD